MLLLQMLRWKVPMAKKYYSMVGTASSVPLNSHSQSVVVTSLRISANPHVC